PDLSPALQPTRLIVMETAGWAGLEANTREGFDRILAVLRDVGVEVLRSTDDPLIEAFERGIAEAKAINTDICDWESGWSFENLVEQYPANTVTHFMKGSRPAVSCRLTTTAYACCSARRRRTGSPRSAHLPPPR